MKLDIKGVSKSFADKHVLEDIHFSVESGSFVSLIGPSGSGKSTLFNLIGGLLTPDNGQIFMDDEDITGKRGLISYMPQQAALFSWRTILDNVLLGQELSGLREEERAVDMLKKAGLADVIHAYPHELSGGMKQRASFIRSLLSPQPFLCLDEPFSALDEFTRLDMQKWLLEILDAYERSILFITHSIDEAIFLSDKIVVLSANPARVKAVIDIPFERPRSEELLLTNEFLEWKKKVLEVVDMK